MTLLDGSSYSVILMAVILNLTVFPGREEKKGKTQHSYYSSVILDHFNLKKSMVKEF